MASSKQQLRSRAKEKEHSGKSPQSAPEELSRPPITERPEITVVFGYNRVEQEIA
jgi:hypothetical protein